MSKLANLCSAAELGRRLAGTGVNTACAASRCGGDRCLEALAAAAADQTVDDFPRRARRRPSIAQPRRLRLLRRGFTTTNASPFPSSAGRDAALAAGTGRRSEVLAGRQLAAAIPPPCVKQTVRNIARELLLLGAAQQPKSPRCAARSAASRAATAPARRRQAEHHATAVGVTRLCSPATVHQRLSGATGLAFGQMGHGRPDR